MPARRPVQRRRHTANVTAHDFQTMILHVKLIGNIGQSMTSGWQAGCPTFECMPESSMRPCRRAAENMMTGSSSNRPTVLFRNVFAPTDKVFLSASPAVPVSASPPPVLPAERGLTSVRDASRRATTSTSFCQACDIRMPRLPAKAPAHNPSVHLIRCCRTHCW